MHRVRRLFLVACAVRDTGLASNHTTQRSRSAVSGKSGNTKPDRALIFEERGEGGTRPPREGSPNSKFTPPRRALGSRALAARSTETRHAGKEARKKYSG
jgi:hypothetical protein